MTEITLPLLAFMLIGGMPLGMLFLFLSLKEPERQSKAVIIGGSVILDLAFVGMTLGLHNIIKDYMGLRQDGVLMSIAIVGTVFLVISYIKGFFRIFPEPKQKGVTPITEADVRKTETQEKPEAEKELEKIGAIKPQSELTVKPEKKEIKKTILGKALDAIKRKPKEAKSEETEKKAMETKQTEKTAKPVKKTENQKRELSLDQKAELAIQQEKERQQKQDGGIIMEEIKEPKKKEAQSSLDTLMGMLKRPAKEGTENQRVKKEEKPAGLKAGVGKAETEEDTPEKLEFKTFKESLGEAKETRKEEALKEIVEELKKKIKEEEGK